MLYSVITRSNLTRLYLSRITTQLARWQQINTKSNFRITIAARCIINFATNFSSYFFYVNAYFIGAGGAGFFVAIAFFLIQRILLQLFQRAVIFFRFVLQIFVAQRRE